MSDTIAALATAPGRAALAIVRISGPGTAPILWELTGVPISARRASVRRLKHDGMLIDETLVLWMPGPNSYTGEDMAELQLHGGPGVVGAALEAVTAMGARLAQPGEFTRRAFARIASMKLCSCLKETRKPHQRWTWTCRSRLHI